MSRRSAKKAVLGRGTTIADVGSAEENPHSYAITKKKCLQSGTLWKDPDFPPIRGSMFFRNPPIDDWALIKWKRPHEICKDSSDPTKLPHLFVDSATRDDVVQGTLGDCWLLAAIACLTNNRKMLSRVVPEDQSFDTDYAGIFRFRFWQYGRWLEVLVDDRLPTYKNKLIYMRSASQNEFWSALLEKAYAKLNGSYEALVGGLTSEALTDFTGGIVESFELGSKTSADLPEIMMNARDKGALLACSIDAGEGDIEGKLDNGLIIGHSYSVTDIRSVNYQRSRGSKEVTLVRVRNPWADSNEWKGAWSDSSDEWQFVKEHNKQVRGSKSDDDGEFWMSFDDFVNNFQRLDVCYLGPDNWSTTTDIRTDRKWEGRLFEGEWCPRVNAGGRREKIKTYWTNPQYLMSVEIPDDNDKQGNGSVIVGLMQKDRRKLRQEKKKELTIGYSIYKAPKPLPDGTLDQKFFEKNKAVDRSGSYVNTRDICRHHKLPPGDYIVIPSTYEPDQEGSFVLRIFAQRMSDAAACRELDDVTAATDDDPVAAPNQKADSNGNNGRPYLARTNSVSDYDDEKLREAFKRLGGEDRQINAYDLQKMLNDIFKTKFEFEGFSTDATRSMVALLDENMTGTLEYEEFKQLWIYVKTCASAYKTMDMDKNGYFDSFEFKTALKQLGFRVSNATFRSIALRYSDNAGRVLFNDFVAAYIRLRTLFDKYGEKDPKGSGKVLLDMDEYLTTGLYS